MTKEASVQQLVEEFADSRPDYRFECAVKHLGNAQFILKECYEEALNEGISYKTAEKIFEVLNEHSQAESYSLERMLSIPDSSDIAKKLISGIRDFRRAVLKAGLTKGKGSIEDIETARLWNSIMLVEAIEAAKKFPGKECIIR